MARILLVDDEEMILVTLRAFLERKGHQVVACGTGQEAFARFQAEPFDIVLTDLRMPGWQGTELVEAVRGVDTAVPVLMMTGLLEGLSEQRAIQLGIAKVMRKPVSLRELLGRIDGLLAPVPQGTPAVSHREGA